MDDEILCRLGEQLFQNPPKRKKGKTIKVKLPSQKRKPVPVKVFVTVPCPYGSPKFPGIRKIVEKFYGASLEVLNLWENLAFAFEYIPTQGTAVNDKWMWAESGNYLDVLEEVIKNELKPQKPET